MIYSCKYSHAFIAMAQKLLAPMYIKRKNLLKEEIMVAKKWLTWLCRCPRCSAHLGHPYNAHSTYTRSLATIIHQQSQSIHIPPARFHCKGSEYARKDEISNHRAPSHRYSGAKAVLYMNEWVPKVFSTPWASTLTSFDMKTYLAIVFGL